MKKLLFILSFLICAYVSNGQVPQTPYSPNAPTAKYKVGYLIADSALIATPRDTSWNPALKGSMVYWQHAGVDSSFWVFSGAVSGSRWQKVVTLPGGGSGGLVIAIVGNSPVIISGTPTVPIISVDTTIILATKAYVQNQISAMGNGTVYSIATNNGSGITGGTITTNGTLAADTTILSTKAYVNAQLTNTGAASIWTRTGGTITPIAPNDTVAAKRIVGTSEIVGASILSTIGLQANGNFVANSTVYMPALPAANPGYAVTINRLVDGQLGYATMPTSGLGSLSNVSPVGTQGLSASVTGNGTATAVITYGMSGTTITPGAISTGQGNFTNLSATGVISGASFTGSGASLTGVVLSFQGTSGQISTTGTQNIVASLADVNANTGQFNNVTLNSKGQATSATNVAYITGNQNITFTATGDVSASTTGTTTLAPVFTLTTVNATPGTFGSSTQIPIVTVDAKGRTIVVALTTVSSSAASISLTSTNGVSITTNGTTSPYSAIIGLGNITPTSVAASGPISGTLLDLAQQSSPVYSPWRMVADPANAAFTMFVGDPNVGLQVGQEEWIWVKNVSGSTIPNGSVVYLSGANGGLPTIGLAQANAASTTIGAGIATEDIANNATGYVTCLGTIHQLNTAGFAAGSIVYVSATTPGALTNTAPTAPNYRYRVGIVGVSSASTGTIHVTPSTASIGNGTANQLFGMNTGGTAQELKSLAGDPNITVTGGTGAITITLNSSISVTNFTSTGTTTLATATVSTLTVGNITITGGISGVISGVNGTANQITSTQVGSVVTLTLPQSISTASAVQFSSATVTGTSVLTIISTTQGTTARADIKNLSVTANENVAGNLIVGGTINATGNITGTLATAAQPNITSVGTLTAVTTTGTITAVGLSVVNATFTAMTVTNTAAMSVVTISNTLTSKSITATATISTPLMSSTVSTSNTLTNGGLATIGNLTVTAQTNLKNMTGVGNIQWQGSMGLGSAGSLASTLPSTALALASNVTNTGFQISGSQGMGNTFQYLAIAGTQLAIGYSAGIDLTAATSTILMDINKKVGIGTSDVTGWLNVANSSFGSSNPDLVLAGGNQGGGRTFLSFFKSAVNNGDYDLDAVKSGVGGAILGLNRGNGGAVICGSSITATSFITSDTTLKNIIYTQKDKKMPMIKYYWKKGLIGKDKFLHWGYGAQYVEKILPGAVLTDDKGVKAVNYDEVHTYKIAVLEDEIRSLKSKNKNLEERLSKLEKLLLK